MTPQSWFILAGFVALVAIFAVVLVAARRGANALSQRVFALLGVISEKNDEIARLERYGENLDDRNERLHNDLKAMRERLPRVDTDSPAKLLADVGLSPTTTGSFKWDEGLQRYVPADIDRFNDPAVTRPYIPTYEVEEGEER